MLALLSKYSMRSHNVRPLSSRGGCVFAVTNSYSMTLGRSGLIKLTNHAIVVCVGFYVIRASPDGPFTDIAISEQTDAHYPGRVGTLSFTDDFTQTGDSPPTGGRFYRIQMIP